MIHIPKSYLCTVSENSVYDRNKNPLHAKWIFVFIGIVKISYKQIVMTNAYLFLICEATASLSNWSLPKSKIAKLNCASKLVAIVHLGEFGLTT